MKFHVKRSYDEEEIIDLLTAFFMAHDPDKVESVLDLIEKNRGHETDLILRLEKRYLSVISLVFFQPQFLCYILSGSDLFFLFIKPFIYIYIYIISLDISISLSINISLSI